MRNTKRNLLVLNLLLSLGLTFPPHRGPVATSASAPPARKPEAKVIVSRDDGRRDPRVNLSDGFTLPQSAINGSSAEPAALAAGDFDEDGVPDLLCGYLGVGRGAVALHRGVAPLPGEVGGALTRSPFLAANVFELPEFCTY